MNVHQLEHRTIRYSVQLLAALLLGGICFIPAAASAATVNVNVGDNFFSPKDVSINASDTVQWTWIGSGTHNSISDTGLWNSGTGGKGKVFTHTFSDVGIFPYKCTIHATQQKGTVTVQAAQNQPPTVSIVSPAPGAVFAAPWTGTIQAASSDTDGTVSTIAFYVGNTLLGSVTNPGPESSGTVSELAAGSYNLKAVATDNLGLTNASAVVSVSVLDPAPITLSNAERISPSSFQFNYSGTPGLSYIIRRTADFGQWTLLATNTATGNTSSFLDTNADGLLNLYSVSLVPNP